MENSVVLIDYMGGDNLHAVNAWASTFLELGIELPDDIHARTDALTDAIQAQGKRKRSVPELLNYLANNGHTSPFRASSLIYAMTIELATHIQLLTHTVAIKHTNAESARYKELMEDKYYLPTDWLQYGVQGKVFYQALEEHTKRGNELYHGAIAALTEAGMSKQRAKETARYFKGYNSQLNVVRSMSFDGLMQLWSKRGEHSPSQREIAGVVEGMVQAVRDIPGEPFKHSLAAFGV
jgi:thymidylate synthase ThyX